VAVPQSVLSFIRRIVGDQGFCGRDATGAASTSSALPLFPDFLAVLPSTITRSAICGDARRNSIGYKDQAAMSCLAAQLLDQGKDLGAVSSNIQRLWSVRARSDFRLQCHVPIAIINALALHARQLETE